MMERVKKIYACALCLGRWGLDMEPKSSKWPAGVGVVWSLWAQFTVGAGRKVLHVSLSLWHYPMHVCFGRVLWVSAFAPGCGVTHMHLISVAAPSCLSGFQEEVGWRTVDVKLTLFLILRNHYESESLGWWCCSYLESLCTPVAVVLGMWTDGDLFMGRTGALWEEATEIDLRFLLKWIRRYPGSLYSQTFMRLKDTRHKKCFDTSFNTNIAPEIGVLICWFWRWNRTDASHLDGLECEKKACEPWTGSWFLVIIYTCMEQTFIDDYVLVLLMCEYTLLHFFSEFWDLFEFYFRIFFCFFKRDFWICFRWCDCLSNGECRWLVLLPCKTKR